MSANPALIACDADALIQVFCVGRLEPLKCLRNRFDVQPIVVPEVELEILSHRRLGPTIAESFKKAVDKHLVRVLTIEELRSQLGSGSPLAQRGCQAVWDDIQSRGEKYELYVDRGEAFTHAAAVELSVPVVSNDARSIRAMKENRLQTSRTLRVFDLYALAVQTGQMQASDIGKVRARLQSQQESIPRAFANCSFEDGLGAFGVRVVDASLPFPEGAENPLRLHPKEEPSPSSAPPTSLT